MKKRVIYLVAFIFCLSYFSLAKQTGKNCDSDTSRQAVRVVSGKKSQTTSTKPKGFDRLPFRIFIFSI
jgi:hypothetical protein